MVRARTSIGKPGTLTWRAYIIVDGHKVPRPDRNRERPTSWAVDSRVRIGHTSDSLRRVRAEGKTKELALDRLQRKIDGLVEQLSVDGTDTATGASTPATPLSEHLAAWLIEQQHRVEVGDRAVGTVLRYRLAISHDIDPHLGAHTLGKITTGQIARFLRTLSPAVAKTCRAILRSAFDQALVDGAVRTNPAVGLPQISRPRSTIHRATGLNRQQADELLNKLYSDPQAVTADVPDVLMLIACTGCRTAEALALAWKDVDLDAGTVTICATVNAKGQRQEHTKTHAGMRTLALPRRCVTMLHRRAQAHGGYSTLVYPAERMGTGNRRDHDTPRWTTNFTGQVRRFLDKHGYPGMTARSLRKMVATELDKAGLTGRQIADQLGHAKPSITMDIYQIRIGQGPTQAATLLE
jgi:integrase